MDTRILEQEMQRLGWLVLAGDEWKTHAPCYGKGAASAAIYPFKLCRAILNGFVKEMKAKGRRPAAKLVMPASHQERTESECVIDEDAFPEVCGIIVVMLIKKAGGKVLVDAATGQILDERLVNKARQLEMIYFETFFPDQ